METSLNIRGRRVWLAIAVIAIAVVVGLFPGTANAATTSQIDQRYKTDTALATMLGTPTGSEFSVAGGKQRNYKWGSLYYSSATGVHEVHGAILNRYKSLGGPAGKLGFPTTDEGHTFVKYDYPDQRTGARNNFQKGALAWNKYTNKVYWFGKKIADELPYGSYPYFGQPQADETAAAHGGRKLDLGGEAIYATPTGVFYVGNSYPAPDYIYGKYVDKGADGGFLGLPTGPRIHVGGYNDATNIVQPFEGGAVYQCYPFEADCHEAFEIHGAIKWTFDHSGGLTKFGLPVSDEKTSATGKISYFEHGEIAWNSKTNKTSYKTY